MTGGAILAGPTHVDDDRVITAGILRQNAQTSLKGASAICHRSDGAVSTFAVDTVFEGKRKRSPTTRTRAVLIAGLMMLEREAALKPAR